MRCVREPGPPRSVPDRGGKSPKRADDAEDYAAASIYFALTAIGNAEAQTWKPSMLELTQSR
jgi:hypothetical protein